MKKNTMEYTAPEMEIVLVMVENGFFGSDPLWGEDGEAGDGFDGNNNGGF